ncbi:CASP-like protein 1E1 [Juglans microcarpa x Juglans regia]|uniref:CASP-like protein 1E1 n=1 Tax=Juglans microcarpa x Juglans regia TaxID=2249226 RepID=UPI001B7E4203|nr:CASP-like protein 1E1 [Juglans microcarpa x Juglans regia]
MQVGRLEKNGMEAKMGNGRTAKRCELLLRLLALALTLVAAILTGVDKQTAIVPVELVASLPPLNVPVSAKWHYLSAFVYLMVTNIIACSYAALSMLLTFTSRGENIILGSMILILDTLMVALLFSGTGAATAVGLIGYHGNSHVRWEKVCNVFGKFCGQVAASIVVSVIGAVAFILLVVFSALRLHKKSK